MSSCEYVYAWFELMDGVRWDEWVHPTRLLKFSESNLNLQKTLQQANAAANAAMSASGSASGAHAKGAGYVATRL